MKHHMALALVTLFCILATSVSAQDNQWSLTKGDNIIEVTSAGIHVKQGTLKDTNAFALGRKPLHFTDSSAWRVAFDVRYGQLQPVGSTVKLGIGDKLIGAVGADQTGMKVYLGNDTMKFLQPTDSEWHHFEFVCDGVTSSVWHNGVKINEEPTQGKPDTLIVGAWSEGNWLSRQTELWMRNLDTNTANPPSQTPLPTKPAASLPPSPQILSPVSEITPLSPTDTSIICQVGDRLQIAGTFTTEQEFDKCVLVVDGSVAATRYPSLSVDDYRFVWTPKTPGTHTLELRYSNFHSKVTARKILVAAQAAPSAVFANLPASAVTDASVTVTGAGPQSFPLARVDFYLNDKPVSVAAAAPFTAMLPIEQITQPGTYPVKFIAYDTAGHPFHSHTSLISIPQRVQVTAPRAFTCKRLATKRTSLQAYCPESRSPRSATPSFTPMSWITRR